MNNNIKDTNANANNEIMGIVTGDKVIVRTNDFYPFLCSEREFSVIDVSTYNTLMSFKGITKEETDTEEAESEVVTDDNDTDPDDIDEDLEEDDEDVPVEIYEELLKYKELEKEYKEAAKSNTVRIRVSDFYPNNCSAEEYCDVSREVYEELMKNKREDHAQRVKNARHLINADFDEIQCGEMYGIVTESNTKNILAALWMKEIMLPKSEELYRRSLMYYVQGLSVGEMAKIEGVEKYAIYASIRKMNRIVHSAAKGLFNSTSD